MTIEKRCYACRRKWAAENYPNPLPWGIVYDFCALCRKEWLEFFERQFTRKRLRTENKGEV